jgi:hypothetical protein
MADVVDAGAEVMVKQEWVEGMVPWDRGEWCSVMHMRLEREHLAPEE